MKELMSVKEKKFVMVLSTVVIWVLLILSFNVASNSGMIEGAVNVILSSYFLMTMVIQAILATLIMGIGYTAFITVKQNNAYKKAQEIVKKEQEEKNEKSEYIVE